MIEVGKRPPALTLNDTDGKKHSLKDYGGQHVLVYFYPKDDTPGCTKQACGFRDLWKPIQTLGAVVLGVSADDADSHEAFRKKYRLPFPLLCDPGHKVMTRYGAYGEKVLYGRKSIGVIRSAVWVGPDGKVVKHWARVASAAKHPQKFLDLLKEFEGIATT